MTDCIITFQLIVQWLHINLKPNIDLLSRLWSEGLPSLYHFLPIVPSSLCTSIVPSSLTLRYSECCHYAHVMSIIWKLWSKNISRPHIALLPGGWMRSLSCNRPFTGFWHLTHIPGLLLQTCSSSLSSSSLAPAGATVLEIPHAYFQNTDLSLFKFQLKESMFKAPNWGSPQQHHSPADLLVCFT